MAFDVRHVFALLALASGLGCTCVDLTKFSSFACGDGGACAQGLVCCGDGQCRLSCTDGGTGGGHGQGGGAGGGGGSSRPDAGSCNASTCPTGCCNGEVCEAGNTVAACGRGGFACASCQGPQDTCSNGVCSGCAASCATGCCVGSTCTARAANACGGNGQACVDCGATGDSCSPGGQCQCGGGGPCALGQACRGGRCVCDETTCPDGCCTATGQCLPTALQNSTQCGQGTRCAPCMAPPGATCTSATVRKAFQAPGSCESGVCSYSWQELTCTNGCTVTVDGGLCEGDVCQGCLTPPPSTCLGSVARVYSSPGTCNANGCGYASQDTNCPFGCSSGSCNADPCIGVSCTTPPAPSCSGGSKVSYQSPGSCSAGACVYSMQTSACAQGCNSATGNCNVDLCADVKCDAAPAAVCLNSTTRRGYVSPGACANGVCTYSTQDITCANGCVNGQCQGDPCAGVTCNAPPPAVCVSGSLRTYSPSGTCSGGGCTYPSNDTGCPFGCANGACNPDPCANVTCTTPPNAYCSGNVRHSFAANGTCSGGGCTYAESTMTCAASCVNGACTDPCAGVNCSGTPSPTCANGSTKRVYTGGGTCTAGSCGGYPYTDVACNTPPGPSCSAGVLTTYSSSGTCSGGTCSYAPSTMNCAFGCNAAGTGCAGDPCAGVNCSATPAAVCANGSTQRVYTGGGTCTAGSCGNYPYTDVACDMPPGPSCSAGVLTTYGSGSCSSGACGYLPSTMSCTFGCNAAGNGCAADPCAGVTCSTPATSCANASTQRVYTGPGTCSAGTCSGAPFTDVACPTPAVTCATATLLRTYNPGACSGGSCSNTYTDVDCSTQPVPDTICYGNKRRVFSGPGACTTNACTFTYADYACGVNRVCLDGVCELACLRGGTDGGFSQQAACP